ncbi:MAG: hypothetical protein IKF91_04605 [Bacilli bacterium]|nr:hypothetical protein [Bacilli bacterium]
MKKLIIYLILLGLIITGIFTFKQNKKETKLKKIKVGDATITSKHHLTH